MGPDWFHDRAGSLEICQRVGTVFLDAVAEIEPAIEVKLLRVLEARTFQCVGETRERQFHGKLIAAANRDLAAEIEAGRFREDFYDRLGADVSETPSLVALEGRRGGDVDSVLTKRGRAAVLTAGRASTAAASTRGSAAPRR